MLCNAIRFQSTIFYDAKLVHVCHKKCLFGYRYQNQHWRLNITLLWRKMLLTRWIQIQNNSWETVPFALSWSVNLSTDIFNIFFLWTWLIPILICANLHNPRQEYVIGHAQCCLICMPNITTDLRAGAE